MGQTIRIRCKNNGKVLNAPIGSTLAEIYKQLDLGLQYGPVSARVNNKVEGLHYRVYHDKDLSLIHI